MAYLDQQGLEYFWDKIKTYVDENAGGGSGGGLVVSDTAPSNTNVLWVDTSVGGVEKYYNGTSWVTTKAVWG